MIEQILIYGAILGAIYALLALGFTLIYGVAGVVNMSHGALFMLGAYMFYAFGPQGPFGLDPLSAFIMSVIVTGAAGAVIYLLIIHPVLEDPLAVLVTTVGASLIIQQIIIIQFSSFFVPVPRFIEGATRILGTMVAHQRIAAFFFAMSLFAILWIFIKKAKIGNAMRAVALDHEVAMLMGINTTRLYVLTMAISSVFAAIAGVLISSSMAGVAFPTMWMTPLYMSFSIVILGGLGSVKGTLIAGFIVGLAENAVVTIIPQGSYLRGAVALSIMALVLLLRPSGLFGKRVELEE